jgi:hypothetical protein
MLSFNPFSPIFINNWWLHGDSQEFLDKTTDYQLLYDKLSHLRYKSSTPQGKLDMTNPISERIVVTINEW